MASIKAAKIQLAIEESAKMLQEHGLVGWSTTVNNSRSPIAKTTYAEKTISYSKYFVYCSDKETFHDVTKHEIAHALIGPGYGHGQKFLDTYAKINDNKRFSGDTTDIFLKKYSFECPECGTFGSINKKSDFYCISCAKNGSLQKVELTINSIPVVGW